MVKALRVKYPRLKLRPISGLVDDGTVASSIYMETVMGRDKYQKHLSSYQYMEGRQWENQPTGLSSAQTSDMSKQGFW